MKYLTLFITLWSYSIIASSSDIDFKPYDQCLQQTASTYQINPSLLLAIIKTESNFEPRAININTSGSEDVGLMQINSEWLPRIHPLGYDRESLFDPCTNISVGSWILAQEIQRFGYTWNAVGAYNAGPSLTPDRSLRRARYAHRVFNNLDH